MDLLDTAFSPSFTRFLDCVSALLQAVALSFIIYLSWHRAMANWRYGDTSQELSIPLIVHWSLILSGLALSVVICLFDFAGTAMRGKGAR